MNYDEQAFEARIYAIDLTNCTTGLDIWVGFPTTAENIADAYKRIGIDGIRYGPAIGEITTEYPYLEKVYNENFRSSSVDELQYFANQYCKLNQYAEIDLFAAIVETEYPGGLAIDEAINLCNNLDCYDMLSGIYYDDDLADEAIAQGLWEVPEEYIGLFDPVKASQYVQSAYPGSISKEQSAYVFRSGKGFQRDYTGPEDIPVECRVDPLLPSDERGPEAPTRPQER